MSGKNLVLGFLTEMLSANQIARFFKFEYLKNRLTIKYSIYYDDIIPQVEYTDGATLFVGMPKHAQACLTLPNWFLDALDLKVLW